MPFNYIAGLYLYFFDLRADYDVVLEDITKSNAFTYNPGKFDNQPLRIILIIGESARGDKQSLNGYPLETNPNLSKINNLISYSNVQSCGTNSRYSITCLLSKEDRESFKFPYDKSNILSVFNALGFNTSFLSTQTLYEQSSESGKINLINVAIKDAKTKILLNTIRAKTPYEGNIYDEYLIPFMQKIFDNNKQNNFMVLYLSGSHVPYANKSPEKFKKFNCSNYGSCKDNQNTLLADYDNSILYTDYVISQIIETFQDGNTLIYYVSDHAENLGENGRYAHGNLWDEINNPYLIHVPQFIWLSNNMKAKLPNEYNNMLSKKNNKINHDYVFHSLLDCIGISSNLINKKLSLCR
jgi:glucan phosphoethanolaminetransferase (alkaline phosphatase superfamily)